ncbi:MAG TPA: cytochrome c3 family protein, partial [candidate division Zixibacteria bacterium]|nr:cytochrome c3 family protein [candidate division Zixibacteria bacterium]
PTQVCMNCHKIVLPESEKLLPIRESWATDIPMKWVRVHQLPDFVYFDHSMHVTRGVSCISCHGNIANMDVVTQNQPLNMHWCLSCHRNPEPNIRPVDEVTNMNWKRPAGFDKEAKKLIEELKIAPPTDCSGCHR